MRRWERFPCLVASKCGERGGRCWQLQSQLETGMNEVSERGSPAFWRRNRGEREGVDWVSPPSGVEMGVNEGMGEVPENGTVEETPLCQIEGTEEVGGPSCCNRGEQGGGRHLLCQNRGQRGWRPSCCRRGEHGPTWVPCCTPHTEDEMGRNIPIVVVCNMGTYCPLPIPQLLRNVVVNYGDL